MIICKICNKEFYDNRKFSIHLRYTHNLSSEDYYRKYFSNVDDSCIFCGNKTRFLNIEKGFANYCSVSCANKDPKRIEMIKQKMKEKYGEQYTNPSQISEIKEKKKKTLQQNYGVSSPLQSKEIKERFFKTNREKFGFDYPMSNHIVCEKSENSRKEKYGEKHLMKLEKFKNISKNTCKKKFGFEFASQNKDIKNKMRKKAIQNSYNLLLNSDRLKGKFLPLFSLDDYEGTDNYQIYKWKCLECNNEFESHADNGFLPRCPHCNPVQKFHSSYELEIIDFLKENGIQSQQGNRSILFGSELDIFIESKKIAIEMNGLFWHSEICGKKDFLYHLKKTEDCKKKSIKLIHIFEDEWVYKKNIVKSILKNKMGITENNIYARKCIIKEVEKKEAELFLINNHLQGTVNFSKSFGLYFSNELVSLICFGKPRFTNEYEWEILRFCNKLNFCVIGGFSKIFNFFVKMFNPKNIISYSDRRFGEGTVYLNSKFYFLRTSRPSYFYVEFGKMKRYNRILYRKDLLKNKLKIFDNELSEWKNMQLNGFDRIWDCGHNVYVWKNS